MQKISNFTAFTQNKKEDMKKHFSRNYGQNFIFYSLILIFTACGGKKNNFIAPPKNSGIGLITIKKEALDAKRTEFEFYNEKEIKTKYGEYDFFKQAEGGVDIVPEYYYPERKLCYFVCTGWDPTRYYVIANKNTQEEKYLILDTTNYRFIRWEDFMKNIGTVERISAKDNPVLEAPKRNGITVRWDKGDANVFDVLDIYKKWIRVKEPKSGKEGWLVWVHENEFKVRFDPKMIRAPWEFSGWEDPSARKENFIIGH
ncbi:MAG: hypothetical protein NW226_24635 [Microscillaceae bacterium]|nr:hypothetical protein [Microscillaceae bacterium]